MESLSSSKMATPMLIMSSMSSSMNIPYLLPPRKIIWVYSELYTQPLLYPLAQIIVPH